MGGKSARVGRSHPAVEKGPELHLGQQLGSVGAHRRTRQQPIRRRGPL